MKYHIDIMVSSESSKRSDGIWLKDIKSKFDDNKLFSKNSLTNGNP